ncbi:MULTISPECIES: DegT/DnrJ/EryC1/StrS family aminotransferase [Limnochorda]|uniref:DegT/DnrJ/EryC1/StrS family aminotransferase n=1 Tax=Limnochorda TaxID=1676651 RepID=UPI0026F056F8|nr:DegT/DnrJ/EryC1/StrS family aminotransferase [Limnochorda pilosa]
MQKGVWPLPSDGVAPIPIAKPFLTEREYELVREVLDSGQLAEGSYVHRFEEAFAAAQGVPYVVATSNGTTALHTALLAVGVRPGDKVLTTPFTFIATANAILFCGARPVFADVSMETANLDPASVEAALKADPSIRYMLVVHLYGLPAPMRELMALAEAYDVTVVEDCAQAHLATLDGQPVGTFGRAAAFSFYATKNLTTGEGGCVATTDPEVAERARLITHHGQTGHYFHEVLGYNYRMTNVEAAIGLGQVERIEAMTEARRANAAFYTQAFQGHSFGLPVEPPGYRHVYHQYTLRVPGKNGEHRDQLAAFLKAEGIGTGIHYPRPLTRQPSLAGRFDVVGDGELPVAEELASQVLSLPVHPLVSEADRERVAEAVLRWEAQALR